MQEVQKLLDKLTEQGFTPEPQDSLSISYPKVGFTQEGLDNLRKLVDSKGALIQKALGMGALPIEIGDTEITFPWFQFGMSQEETTAYAQFICALCKTALEKKRVTAKGQESYENEKFTLRVFMIGLGLVGKEYALIRKLMLQNLSGCSGWRYGAPTKAADAPQEAPADTIRNEPEPQPEGAETAPQEPEAK